MFLKTKQERHALEENNRKELLQVSTPHESQLHTMPACASFHNARSHTACYLGNKTKPMIFYEKIKTAEAWNKIIIAVALAFRFIGRCLFLELHIAHERFGSSSEPSIHGHLHYPNDVDRSLNETVPHKIRV